MAVALTHSDSTAELRVTDTAADSDGQVSISADPPGPKGLPYIGCLHGLLRNPMKFWLDVAERYGPIAKVPLKGKDVYHVADPQLLYELLVTQRKKYRKNTRYRAAVEVLG